VCLISRAVTPVASRKINVNGQLVDHDIDQIVYYQAGVGTSSGPLTRLKGDATGAGLKQNVREAYGFICHNWGEGDEIYLFGFSRGAYTARAIAGLISQFGLLTSRGMDGFWAVMKDYTEGNFKYEPKRSATIEELARKYERHPSHKPHKAIPIKFVGVFDTVRSIGLPKVYFFNQYVGCINRWIISYNKKRIVEDATLHPNIDFAYHALSLDERRAPFQPSIWALDSAINNHTTMEQVWFPGVHCSVGGGDTYRGLSTVSLCWMAQKIHDNTDLVLDNDYIVASLGVFAAKIKGVTLDEIPAGWGCTPWQESYVGFYHLGGRRARKPGRYHRVKEGQTTNEGIHHSVAARQENIAYAPPPLGELPFVELGNLEKDLRGRIWEGKTS